MEKLGRDYTKMDKAQIQHYGPGDQLSQYVDPSDLFDGGDSEMGLTGDGNIGLKQIGRDVSPHMARTYTAKSEEDYAVSSLSYSDELLQSNPGMDPARAQQYENWAEQQEIAQGNRYMNERGQYSQGQYVQDDTYENDYSFTHPAEIGEDIEGIIPLRAPVNGVAAYEVMLKNPYMGFAKFRASFVGDAPNEWSVTPNDGYLKQHEETQFIVRYAPKSSGLHNAYLVIETEDFVKTWKVVGSTGEYEF